LSNLTPFSQKLQPGTPVGEATNVVVEPVDQEFTEEAVPDGCEVSMASRVQNMTEEESADRKRKLADTIKNDGCSLPWQERSQLHSLLLKHHDMFQLDNAE